MGLCDGEGTGWMVTSEVTVSVLMSKWKSVVGLRVCTAPVLIIIMT